MSVPKRPFGPTGQLVSVICQGTWNLEHTPRATAADVLRRGLDLGLNHIDTAEMYGNGGAEEVVAMAAAGQRDRKAIRMMITPVGALGAGGPPELGADHHDRLIQQAPLLEIADQPGDRQSDDVLTSEMDIPTCQLQLGRPAVENHGSP